MTPYAQAHIIGVFYCEGVIMTILLLLVIYIAYIGLGIPDSLFGPAWPAMHVDFGLGVHIAGYLTPLFSLFTVLSSLSSSRLIHRYGTWRVSAVSTALTAVGLLGFSFAPNLITLILFAIPLGSGAGAIDAGLNNYVAIHYSAAHMNFLHCFYGVGVSISPYLMALALSEKNNWHIGYRWAAYIQLGITAVMFLSYPLWKSAEKAELASASAAVRDASLRELAAIPGVRAAWLSFFSSVSMEYLCSTWGSTFLVEEKGLSVDAAAGWLTVYFVGLTLGRFLAGLLARRFSSWQIMALGFGSVTVSLVLLLLPGPFWLAVAGLFLIGLGNGPTYPNLMHLTPGNFGAGISGAVIGTQMAAAYVGSLVLPFLYGAVVKAIGMRSFSIGLILLFIMLVCAVRYLHRWVLKKQNAS